MKQYHVTGMSCAACSARVEKAVKGVPGVTECAVSLLTNSMGVEGTASDGDIIRAVTEAGYGCSPKDGGSTAKSAASSVDELTDTETPKMIRRLIASLCLLLPLMYVSMGGMMWGWPVPSLFAGNGLAVGIYEMLLAGLVMVINQKFFISGFKGLIHKAPNMDTLVAMGSFASFAWSVVTLFRMTLPGAMPMHLLHDLYFESAAMILTLITVGKTLEARSKGKTTDALKSLMKLSPRTATLERDGKQVTVPIEEVRPGDIFVLKPGDSVPVDGVIVEGSGSLNESALTGESVPADKTVGDRVSAATINLNGALRCRAERVGEDTTLAQIIRLCSDAAATKAPIARLADKVSGVFVPVVLGIAAVTFIIWLLLGESTGFALARGISVLVISCPCALGLATPVAIMAGSGVGARNGILFKTAASLERAGRTRVAALDKTGTITEGVMSVTDVLPENGSEEALLKLAASLEARSEHPVGRAVVKEAEKRGIMAESVTDFAALPGKGLMARHAGGKLVGGSVSYIAEVTELPGNVKKQAERLSDEGKTPLCFALEDRYIGMIAVRDTLKSDSAEAIKQLKNMGVRVVMITGDNARTAAAMAKAAGVDEVLSGVLPDGKEAAVRSLKKYGPVMMVGDGINDAPALISADVGAAIGAGTDVAIDAADIVLMKSSLSDVAAAIRLSRATLTNIRENLFWAFFYNAVCIPLAAGAFIHWTGWQMSPMLGAAAMSLSSFCVVSNALRLNLIDIHSPRHDHRLKGKAPQTTVLELEVEGMMCHHCERAVSEALSAIDGVVDASADFETGKVLLTCVKPIPEQVLRQAIEEADYALLSVKEQEK